LRTRLQDLPCGGCPYCTRTHSDWSGFDTEVDDVVPLAHKPLDQPTKGDKYQIEDEVKTRVAENLGFYRGSRDST